MSLENHFMKKGIKVAIVVILIGSCMCHVFGQPIGQRPQTMGSKQIKILIDSIGSSLNRYYIFPDKALEMSNYVKSQFKKDAYGKITDPGQLSNQLEKDLQQAHRDPHLGFYYNPGFAAQAAERKKNNHNPAEKAQQLSFLKDHNFFFNRAEVLAGNIGYVSFTGFNGMVQESRPTLKAAFTFLSHTKALIIDLRQNNGGSPDMVRQIESYFFKERTHMMDIINRRDNSTHDFWADPIDADSLTLSMPVYILTSAQTFSAAEDFSYGMQSVGRAFTVGETTGGGAHPTGPFDVGQGFVANIPFAQSMNPYTKTNWEGTGVKPDIAVPASQALEKAIEAIFTRQLTTATNDEEKRKAQWSLYKLKAEANTRQVKEEIFAQYAGIYEGGLDFYAKGDHFYYKNAERGGTIFELKTVSDNLFVLDENVIVEFVKDTNGQYTSLNMLWIGGGLSTKPKIR